MHKHIKKMAIELHKSEHTKNRIFFCKQLQLEREAEWKERASEKMEMKKECSGKNASAQPFRMQCKMKNNVHVASGIQQQQKYIYFI